MCVWCVCVCVFVCVNSYPSPLPPSHPPLGNSPYYLVIYVKWRLTWLWKFTICKQEYGAEEHMYLTRKRLGMSEVQWQVREVGWVPV